MALASVVIRGREFAYEPVGPYIFQSGKKKGHSVESLMFADYGFLSYLKSMSDKGLTAGSMPNKLHLHLAWAMRAGEFLQSRQRCPYCSGDGEAERVKYFSVRYSQGDCSYGFSYTCCDKDACKYQLVEERSRIFPLKFSSLAYFSRAEQKRLGVFFKGLLLDSGRLDSQKAFKLFSASQL